MDAPANCRVGCTGRGRLWRYVYNVQNSYSSTAPNQQTHSWVIALSLYSLVINTQVSKNELAEGDKRTIAEEVKDKWHEC